MSTAEVPIPPLARLRKFVHHVGNMARVPHDSPQFLVELASATDAWRTDQHSDPVPIVDLHILRVMPPGTLGRETVEWMDRLGLKAFEAGPRVRQFHDVFHVLLDYDTTPIGEGELQAFLLGTRLRFPNLILLMGILERTRGQAVKPVLRAFERGRKAGVFPGDWPLETLWSTPIYEVRRRFGIV